MLKFRRLLQCALVVGSLTGPAAGLAFGQNVGGAVHVGTLGFGGRITTALGSGINVRAGIDVVPPLTILVEEEDTEYEVKFPSPSVTAVLDLHPGGSGFRLSAGGGLLRRGPGDRRSPAGADGARGTRVHARRGRNDFGVARNLPDRTLPRSWLPVLMSPGEHVRKAGAGDRDHRRDLTRGPMRVGGGAPRVGHSPSSSSETGATLLKDPFQADGWTERHFSGSRRSHDGGPIHGVQRRKRWKVRLRSLRTKSRLRVGPHFAVNPSHRAESYGVPCTLLAGA